MSVCKFVLVRQKCIMLFAYQCSGARSRQEWRKTPTLHRYYMYSIKALKRKIKNTMAHSFVKFLHYDYNTHTLILLLHVRFLNFFVQFFFHQTHISYHRQIYISLNDPAIQTLFCFDSVLLKTPSSKFFLLT